MSERSRTWPFWLCQLGALLRGAGWRLGWAWPRRSMGVGVRDRARRLGGGFGCLALRLDRSRRDLVGQKTERAIAEHQGPMARPPGVGIVGAGSIGVRGWLMHLCLEDVQTGVRLAVGQRKGGSPRCSNRVTTGV
jgi:hypothetical protein